MEILFSLIPYFIIAIIAIIIICAGYVKAPPNGAYIITGPFKKRMLVGKAGIKIPFLERIDKLSLGAFQIDVKTKSPVPTAEFINVKIDSTVSVKISQDPELIIIAAQNFLNVDKNDIATKINDLLEGNLREIAGTMKLTEMVSNRKVFSEKVQENAVPDLRKLGLELVSFNVQNFVDDNNVIDNLGIDNIEQIRKQAVIAKSDAQREIAIADAQNLKDANDAKAQAAEEIAIRNNALEVKKAMLKKEADTQAAQAEAAMAIEAENQRKLRDVAAANADIATAERQAELKKKEIELREYELDALVRKQADADKYAAEQEAEADLIKRKRDADAKAYEIEMEAQARKAKADADKYVAEQEAAGILAKGVAEAEAIEKKAQAQKKMGEASVIEMILNTLPQITANAAAPLTNVESIHMYGEGNSAKLVGDVMKTSNQILEGVKEATGLDISTILGSYLGSSINNKN